ncbi:MAG: RND family transporter, partial [Candidatus Nanohalobium sp.]
YASVMFFLVLGALIGAYGTGVSTSFSQEDFLPPAHVSPALKSLPEPFAPGDYSSKATLNMIDDKFAGQDSVTMYVQAPMRDPSVLQEIRQRSRNVPASFVTKGGRAEYRSIFDVMDSAAARSPRFRALLDRNDVDNDGLPEKNLKNVYDMLFQVAPDSAGQYLSDSYRSTKLVYTVDSLSSQSEISGDAKSFADRFRISATATGMTIVFQGVSDMIFSSAIKALLISMAVSTAFLVLMYYLAFEKPFLAVANMFPVGLTLALILGTMRFLDVPLNALTATILSITIGLGVDYSVHVTHRFEDELESGRELFEALRVTLRGTGGALTSSMLTTVTGISVLVLAITPILGQFGLITGLSIFYSYLSSLIVLPPALVVWHRLRG